MCWVEDEFKDIHFGDERINKRFLKTMKALGQNTAGSVNESIKDKALKKGAYRLFSNNEFDALEVSKKHREKTAKRMLKHPIVLCLADTTTISHAGKKSIKDLGSVGGKIKRDNEDVADGFLFHAGIALTPSGIPLGVQSFICWSRNLKSHGMGKESEKWSNCFDEASESYTSKTQMIYVADREADQYNLIKHILDNNKDFVIRSKHNRKIHGKNYYLQEEIDKNETVVHHEESDQYIKYGELGFNDPTSLKAENLKHKNVDFVELNYVHTRLYDKEWTLLTSLPINNKKDALNVINYYQKRWQVEEYFKVLKGGGCKVEKSNLRTFDRLVRHLSSIAVISWRIHYLQQLSRQRPEEKAIKHISKSELEALSLNKFKKCTPDIYEWDLSLVIKLIAELGGFNIIKGKEPGLTTLYKGLFKLEAKAETVSDMKESLGLGAEENFPLSQR